MAKRCAAVLAFALLTVGCIPPPPPPAARPANQPTGSKPPNLSAAQTLPAAAPSIPPAAATVPAVAASAANDPPQGAIKPLTQQQRNEMLAARLTGGMGYSFSQFANMFLVSSRIQFGVGVGLMTADKEIAQAELRSPFPEFYEPTLREFLDAIALQTFSQWKCDPTDKFFHSDVPNQVPVADLAMFEFTKAERPKPFKIKLAEGWKSSDEGSWLRLVPPGFPVGLDIHEMGTYSSDKPAARAKLLAKVRDEVALEWARRANPDAGPEDFKPAKVGQHEALFYTAIVPTQIGKDMRWRQWVFMVDNKCYFVISTILPSMDAKLLPDVEKTLATFEAVKPE